MNEKEAREKLDLIDQSHLLAFWDELTTQQKQKLLHQIEKLNLEIFFKQKQLLHSSFKEESSHFLTPFEDAEEEGAFENIDLGNKLIANEEAGAIIIAGGQGTRLGFDGPKGMFPITLQGKTLFQIFAEKVSAASKNLPLAIMTSPINDTITKNFFIENHYFGLQQEQLFFFTQNTLPFLDEQGNLFLENQHTIAEGPDGNGGIFQYFVESGIWKLWHERGIQDLLTIPVDNPLANPFDAELLGFHRRKLSDVTAKCSYRVNENEKVGVFVKEQQRVFVKEYSELSIDEKTARLANGNLKHRYANLGIFCFTMNFVHGVAQRTEQMPLHKAFKLAKCCGNESQMAWKFERFIFDCLPLAAKVSALLCPRDSCFAPLKNAQGEDSIETVRIALQKQEETL